MELSKRETEVIFFIANGFSDKEISKNLKISPRTIQSHVNRICLKLKARNRVHAVTKVFLKTINNTQTKKISKIDIFFV